MWKQQCSLKLFLPELIRDQPPGLSLSRERSKVTRLQQLKLHWDTVCIRLQVILGAMCININTSLLFNFHFPSCFLQPRREINTLEKICSISIFMTSSVCHCQRHGRSVCHVTSLYFETSMLPSWRLPEPKNPHLVKRNWDRKAANTVAERAIGWDTCQIITTTDWVRKYPSCLTALSVNYSCLTYI